MFLLDREMRGTRVCERKFVAPEAAWAGAMAALSLHCVPESAHPRGIVESIYFDDEWFSSYWEKSDGDSYKRKVRLRWYAEEGDAARAAPGEIQAFLDVKDRIGALREKRHIAFRADAALLTRASLRDPALRDLLQREVRAAGLPISEALVPTIGIRYCRHRFVCPCTGAKINLDSEICSPRANSDLFTGAAHLTSGRIVCEAKAQTVQEYPWGESLMRMGFRSQSFSKYGLFMEIHIQGSI
jgi:hypothetical protein